MNEERPGAFKRHDYVTGVYSRAYLDSAFRGHVTAAAREGSKVSAALVRVNEYANLCRALAVFQVFHRLLLQHNRTGCGRKKTCHYS